LEQRKRNELIFWRDVPVDVERGAFEYISEQWGNKVIFISYNGYSKERNQCNWENNLEEIILSDQDDIEQFVNEIINKYPSAIHIFNGFRGKTKKYLKRLSKVKNIKLGILAERPSYSGSIIKMTFRKIATWALYRYYSFKYSKNLSLFLALGQKGVDSYKLFGFKDDTLFPFMYNPLVKVSSENIDTSIIHQTEIIKMLYLGRFSGVFKGVDILLKAIKTIDKRNWQLDFVGGYGDLKDKVLEITSANEHLHFKGTWKSDDVISKISKYDICVIPSKFEGWNLISNEAINAGIGVIVTNQATSDELIEASGAGIVVPANNEKALREAILKVLNHPELIQEFKEKAKIYAPKISSKVVGNYFIDIMDYVFYHDSETRPKCPWL
jgi:glycosyltransferase involved in cell wall biosynthesis